MNESSSNMRTAAEPAATPSDMSTVVEPLSQPLLPPTTSSRNTVFIQNHHRRRHHHERRRMGTIQSATFNIWSTMVGGGSLSLPLAFAKAGNGLVGPILLIITAVLTEFCFGLLIDATYFMNYNDPPPQQQQEPNQARQQLQNNGDHHPEVCALEATNSLLHNDIGSEEVEADTLRIVPPQQQQQQHIEDANEEYDGCSSTGNYTLESITAAAAASFGINHHHYHHHHHQNGSRDTTTATTYSNLAYSISALLVFFMCFFGIIGYCVLLRDMLIPVTQWIQRQQLPWMLWFHHHHPPSFWGNGGTMTRTTFNTVATDNETTVTWANNVSMIMVVFLVTPLCTLHTLTSLQKFSTLSMCSVLILGLCIVYRSVQCHLGYYHNPASGGNDDDNSNQTTTSMVYLSNHDSGISDASAEYGYSGFTWFPNNLKDVLDVLPLFISCYVCHYNIPVVYNDFTHPTPTRVRLWLHITVWGATMFYCIVGIAGSSFALVCGSHHHIVQGNVLLNFDPNDPLLLVGRLCLAVTIALAFPVLTIPARDIILRYMVASSTDSTADELVNSVNTPDHSLTEPLLLASSNDENEIEEEDMTVRTSNVVPPNENTTNDVSSSFSSSSSWTQRLLISICVLWSGTAIASGVSSIDIVWDFLGSSLSIILSYLVPGGCYILLRRRYDGITTHNATGEENVPSHNNNEHENMIVRPFSSSLKNYLPQISTICWIMVSFFTPMIFISTTNAIHNLLSTQ